MSAAGLEEQSLLVKTRPGRERPFELENLRTGSRHEFDSVALLLESLSSALQPGAPEKRSEPCS